MHPSCVCEKAYVVTLRTEPVYRLSASAAAEFASGVRLADGYTCRPARLEVVESVSDPDGGTEPLPHIVRVTLHEGHFHQVKRMLGACGGAVCALHRERIGGLSLHDYPELNEGQVLVAGEGEEAILRSMLPANRAVASS